MPKTLIKSRLVWLTLLLLGIVPVLAVLQWQWIDDLTKREEERLQSTLQVASVQLSFSFNQRLIQVQQAFSSVEPSWNTTDEARKNSRSDLVVFSELARNEWEAWKENPDVALVEGLYYALPPKSLEENWRVTRFDTATGKLVLSEENLAERFDLDFDFMPPISRVVGGLQAIVIPIVFSDADGEHSPKASSIQDVEDFDDPMMSMMMNETVYAIVILNKNYLQTQLFSALLNDHFTPHGVQGIEYDCGILWKKNSESPSKLVCSSHPALKAEELQQNSFILPVGFLPPRPNSRFARMMNSRGASMPPASLFIAGKMTMSNVVGMLASAGVDSTIARKLFGGMELRAQYKPNALQNEISRLRWRNLALSFGALVLLGAGLVLVVMTVSHSERLQRQQMQFVAGISHEFRTPLAVLSSASENLADGIVTSPEQAQRYGKVMKQEITRLTGMVEQTLSFAGIQAGRHTIEPKPISVQMLVEQAITRHRGLLKDEAFLLTVQIPPKTAQMLVLADATALMTVFDNLMTNAVKYTENHREIRIDAVLQDEVIQFSIQDFGRGIAPNEIAHIFEPFFRAQSVVDAQIHGNGLGLAIVQHIITQHGGTISAKSEIGSGTTFLFTLKRA